MPGSKEDPQFVRSTIITACILASFVLQLNVNRLDFFAYHFTNPAERYHDKTLGDPFFSGPIGFVNLRLLRYKGHEDDLPYLASLCPWLQHEDCSKYLQDLRDRLKTGNLYWW